MLDSVTIRNFKRFDEVTIELGRAVVLIGPNNSGKTTALQALALWDLGLKRWKEKRSGGKTVPEKRPGVTINRRDLVAVPVPRVALLWKNIHTRETSRGSGRQRTENIRVEVVVRGVTEAERWECGLEFDYANEESLYCRPRRDPVSGDRTVIPAAAYGVDVAYLPPMSGLSANETRLDAGAINVRLGEGRTAEVLRNLCYALAAEGQQERWESVAGRITDLFGVELDAPEYIAERGEVAMTYRDRSGTSLDLSCAGRGLHQTLLLLAHLTLNAGSVLLLDEPDAHLEILRQRQIFDVLCATAEEHGSQLIAASHSEVVLNEAADRAVVVAFVGKPHRIDDRGSQVAKSLKALGFEQYYQAELRGWVLYLEGSTDLAVLRAFAHTLGHPAEAILADPFVHYVANQPAKARDHFYGLREAKSDLLGYAVFDRIQPPFQGDDGLRGHIWSRVEIECYLCSSEVLLDWAVRFGAEREGPLFATSFRDTMEHQIDELERALRTLGEPSPWGGELKVSDRFLDRLFSSFFSTCGLPDLMRKTGYHELAKLVPADAIDPEVRGVLDAIVEVSGLAAAADPVG